MIDEGYIKYRPVWTPAAALDHPAIAELLRWRRPLFDAGLIGYDQDHRVGYGNVSVRDGRSDRFIISGTQTGHLRDVGAAHFALVTGCDPEKNTVAATGPVAPSSEAMTHGALYRVDPSIRAVVHVHTQDLWLACKDVLPTTGKDVAYGTPEMAREFFRLVQDTGFARDGVAVMAGHEAGMISIGRSLEEAAGRILSLNEALGG